MFEKVGSYFDKCKRNLFLRLRKYSDSQLKQIIPETESSYFEALTPKDDIEKDQYIEALEWALKKEDIKNIALTGTYGSGKSSILKSFEKLNPSYEYLNISLASFNISDNSSQKCEEENINKREDSKNKVGGNINRLIERSILQQIFYKAKPKDVTDSRFKRIYAVNKWRLLGYSLSLTVWLFSVIAIFQPDILSTFSLLEGLNIRDSLSQWFFSIVFILGFIFLIYSLFNLFKNLKFSKLNIAKGEIELKEDSGASILNDHLDELLYFFEVTNYNVVIIEDLDRYDNIDIFTKLREINILLNQSQQINRPINFIYALKDELFKDKHRTKFFDFLIPIIPVINSNNSNEILTKKIEKSGWANQLSKDFISTVSFYIDDMRLLKNIYNEYAIYKRKLADVNLTQDKLFAIIIYKNLYPTDFSKLQNNEGVIPNILRSKYKVIKKIKDSCSERISVLEKEKHEINKECLSSIEDLRRIYIGELFKYFHGENEILHAIWINNENVLLDNLVKDKYFTILKKEESIRVKSNRGSNRNTNFSFKQIEKSINSDKTYDEREKVVEKKKNNRIREINQEIEDLKEKKKEAGSYKLKEILEISSDEEVLGKHAQNRLLVYLLRNGYIDNMYQYYTSYFYEGALKREDAAFINSVIDRVGQPFSFSLSNIEEILEKLPLREFSTSEILNYELVNYMILNHDQYEEKLSAIFKQLANEKEESVEFFEGFISWDGSETGFFINRLCKSWVKIWEYIEKKSNYPKEKKDLYLSLILKFADKEDIIFINKASNQLLREYISNQQDFSNLDEGEVNKVKNVIKNLNVKFSALDKSSTKSPFFEYIYKHTFYKLNRHMIELVLNYMGDVSIDNLARLDTANFSTIKNSTCTALYDYVQENIEEYVKDILLSNEGQLEEDEESFLELLNHEKISEEDKNELIAKQEKVVSDLARVSSPSLYSILLNENKITSSWENIIIYYLYTEEVDEALTSFLDVEENYKELSKSDILVDDEQEEIAEDLSKGIILNKKLSEPSFEAIIKSIPFVFGFLPLEELNKRKVEILLENELLKLSPDNYELLRNNFTPLHIELAAQNIVNFTERFDTYVVDENDLSLIINSSEIDDSAKISILNSYDLDDIEKNKFPAKEIQQLLKKNGLPQIPFQLTELIISNGTSEAEKVELVNSQLEFYNLEETTRIVEALPDPYFKMNRSLNRPTFEKTTYNLSLIKKLDEVGLISSYSVDGDIIRANAKR